MWSILKKIPNNSKKKKKSNSLAKIFRTQDGYQLKTTKVIYERQS